MMTDNEIIKVLEGCKCDTLELALDLINRQKAEIERLNAMVAAAEDYLHPLPFKTAYDEEIQKAKTEAIREFAESLKEHFNDLECSLNRYKGTVPLAELVKHTEWILHEVVIQAIDAFVKEMVGEDDG